MASWTSARPPRRSPAGARRYFAGPDTYVRAPVKAISDAAGSYLYANWDGSRRNQLHELAAAERSSVRTMSRTPERTPVPLPTRPRPHAGRRCSAPSVSADRDTRPPDSSGRNSPQARRRARCGSFSTRSVSSMISVDRRPVVVRRPRVGDAAVLGEIKPVPTHPLPRRRVRFAPAQRGHRPWRAARRACRRARTSRRRASRRGRAA